jgi:hypothetical protein
MIQSGCAWIFNGRSIRPLSKFSDGGWVSGFGNTSVAPHPNLGLDNIGGLFLWSTGFRSPITFSGNEPSFSDQEKFPDFFTGSTFKSAQRIVGNAIHAVDDQPPRWKPCYPGLLAGKNWRIIFEEQQVVVTCYECASPVTCTNIKRKYKVLVCDGDYNSGGGDGATATDITSDVLIDEPYIYFGQEAGSRTDYEICAQRRFSWPNFTNDYNDCGCHLGSAEYMPFPDAHAFTALPENIAPALLATEPRLEEENPLP